MLKSLIWNDYLLILAMLPVPKKAVKIKKIWSVSRITQRPQPKMSQTCQQRKRRPAWQYYVEQEQQHSSDKLSFVYPWWLQTTMLLLSALWRVLLKHRHMNAGQTKRLAFHMQSQILKKQNKKKHKYFCQFWQRNYCGIVKPKASILIHAKPHAQHCGTDLTRRQKGYKKESPA